MIYREGKEKFFVKVCKYCKKPMIERDLSLYGEIYVCLECLEEQYSDEIRCESCSYTSLDKFDFEPIFDVDMNKNIPICKECKKSWG